MLSRDEIAVPAQRRLRVCGGFQNVRRGNTDAGAGGGAILGAGEGIGSDAGTTTLSMKKIWHALPAITKKWNNS